MVTQEDLDHLEVGPRNKSKRINTQPSRETSPLLSLSSSSSLSLLSPLPPPFSYCIILSLSLSLSDNYICP